MFDLWLATLLDSSLKGFVLCLVAGGAAYALRKSSAAARHLVWRATFVGLLVLPALASLLPEWRVSVTRWERPATSLTVRASSLTVLPRPRRTTEAPSAVPRAAAVAPTMAAGGRHPSSWTFSWQALLFATWLAGAAAGLAGLAIALLRVSWQRRMAVAVEDGTWLQILARLRAELGIRRTVELLEGDDRAMPMTWGWRRPMVLLPAGTGDWNESRRRAVLTHELAHVARGDYLAQLAAEVVRALYWFNPLIWRAARKLRLESEHACDDQVIAGGTAAADYAGELLEIARSLRAVRLATPAALAMARPSQLMGRLVAVLDAERNRRALSRRLILPAWLAAWCLVLPLAAMTLDAPPAPPSPARHGTTHKSINHIVADGNETFQWTDGDHRIKVRTEGKFQLTDDWTGIASLSRGTEVRFEEDQGDSERRLDVEPGADGRPTFTWKVDGKERPFDAEGRKWLQGMLLQYVRGTGYDADRRVAWFLEHQGPDGLLAEISQIYTDYGKQIYFEKLFAHRDLGAAVVERALRQAGREIDSDYYLRQTLTAAAKSQRLSEAAVLAYVEASRSISSDYEQRQAVSELAARAALTNRGLVALLQAAQGIDSDYELAEALSQVGGDRLADPEARRAYLAAAATIGSDYEHHRALSKAVKSGKLTPDALIQVIESAEGIGSDYEHASLLVEIASRYTLAGAARDAYAKAASTIRSDYERKKAMEALRPGR